MSAGRASKYHPALAALHWVLAFFISASLAFGFLVLARVPNTEPRKLDMLEWHMGLGTPGSARAAGWAHVAFYVLVFGMVVTGYSTGLVAHLNDIVFARNGAPLPTSFDAYPTCRAHGLIATVLAILVALHVLGALWHWLVRRDGVMRRMGFGGRRVD